MELLLKEKIWWDWLGRDLQELFLTSDALISAVEGWDKTQSNEFHDYAFVVFPAAKAYEGFLKKLFLDLGFISHEDYAGKHFRIGKALNPSLEKALRKKESVYDKIVAFCGGKGLANRLWETWKYSRNLIFHWFPKEANAISFGEAKERVLMVIASIDAAFKECKIEPKRERKT